MGVSDAKMAVNEDFHQGSNGTQFSVHPLEPCANCSPRHCTRVCVCVYGLTHHSVEVECSPEDPRYPGKIWRVVSPFGSILEVKNRNKRRQKENPQRGSELQSTWLGGRDIPWGEQLRQKLLPETQGEKHRPRGKRTLRDHLVGMGEGVWGDEEQLLGACSAPIDFCHPLQLCLSF